MLKSSLILGLQKLEESTGFDLEIMLFIIIIIPSIIFFAKDNRLGAIMFFTLNALLTALLYSLGWSYKLSLIMTFVSIIILSITLFLLSQSNKQEAFL